MENIYLGNVMIKEAFDFLYLHESSMSLNQIDFVKSLKKHFARNKTLSTRQQKALFEVRKYLNIPGQPVRFSGALGKT